MTRERLYHLRELIVRAAKSLSDADAFGISPSSHGEARRTTAGGRQILEHFLHQRPAAPNNGAAFFILFYTETQFLSPLFATITCKRHK